MVLTAEQLWKVATVYAEAAADKMGVPPQQRAAFARKAKWFRMLARIKARKEAALVLKDERLPEGRAVVLDGHVSPEAARAPTARYRTLEEMLKSARARAGA
jgi:hypothetical protein